MQNFPLADSKATAYRSTRYSVLSLRPYQFEPGKDFSIKETLTTYCQKRFISKSVARRFMAKKWLLVTKRGRHIFIEELCTEQIDVYLGIKNLSC